MTENVISQKKQSLSPRPLCSGTEQDSFMGWDTKKSITLVIKKGRMGNV